MPNQVLLYPLVAGLLLALLGWARSKERGDRVAWAAATAFGLGFMLAYYGLKENLPPWPPKESWHWLFYAMILAIPIGALHGNRRSVVHWILGTGLIAAFVWFSSETFRGRVWQGEQEWKMPLAIAGSGAFALLLNSDLIRARPNGIQVPGAFGLTLGTAALLLGQSTGGSALLAGGLGVIAAVWALLGLTRRGHAVHHGSALPFTLGLGGLLYTGVYWSETALSSAAVLMVAPQAIRLGWKVQKPAAQFAISLIACAAVCGIAYYLGYEPPSDNPYR